ncbi:unnamed protein product [Calypogeia fissa]
MQASSILVIETRRRTRRRSRKAEDGGRERGLRIALPAASDALNGQYLLQESLERTSGDRDGREGDAQSMRMQ